MTGMGTTTEYAELVLVLGGLALGLLVWHLARAARCYQRHHDERAAVGLVSAIALVIITSGLVISSVGLLLEDPTFSIVGLSISRGALIILALTLVLADVRTVDRTA